jgi:hypothetical protein
MVRRQERDMAFKDILVALTSYPDPTPVSAVEDAVAVASALGAHLAALACEPHSAAGAFRLGLDRQRDDGH